MWVSSTFFQAMVPAGKYVMLGPLVSQLLMLLSYMAWLDAMVLPELLASNGSPKLGAGPSPWQ